MSDALWIDFMKVSAQRRKLRKQNRIMRDALKELASENCTYLAHGDELPDCEPMDWDPECPGEVCTAKKALHDARAVRA